MSDEEKTALEWVARDYPDSPKKRLKEWFANGRVSLDGEIITKPHLSLTDPGERLLMGKAKATTRVFSKRMPVRIHAQVNLLYIDRSLAIVNKGPGLLSVPGGPEESQNSALKVLEKYLAGQAPAGSKSEVAKPLPVHRLDQYTSGLLCFAMNQSAREHLVKQVRSHSFIREYLALGDGLPREPRGQWKSWFELDEAGLQQTVYDKPTPGATEAVSDYEVLDTISWTTGGNRHTVSRLRLRLRSGLKHQLRIHAARAGVPLLGDRHYHPDYKRAAEAGHRSPHGCKRQALHASSIGFTHPETGKTKRFSSKLPRDLAEVEAALRTKSQA
ncbi:MAG: RluA family pseudouridine synthase [Verrucomicrobiota bacterium]